MPTIGRRLGIPPNGGSGSGNRPKHSGLLRSGNSSIFYVHPDPWGNDPIWQAYSSNGLKPPTRKEMKTPIVVEFFFRGWDPTQLRKDYSSYYNDPIEYILPYIDGGNK